METLVMIFAQSKAKTFGEIRLFIREEINLGIKQMQSFKALEFFFSLRNKVIFQKLFLFEMCGNLSEKCGQD